MPFGLKSAQATYQRCVQNCLHNQIGRNVHAYADDIMVKSREKETLIDHFVGVLGMGVTRLACLQPAAWLKRGPSTAHLHQHKLKTLARGQASRGG